MRSAIYFSLVLSLLTTQLLIPSEAIQAVIPGRCPDVCSRNVEKVFFDCVDQIKNGCALRLCNKPPKSAQCGLKSGVPDQVFTGEKVLLLDVRVNKPVMTNIVIQGVAPKIDVYFLIDATGSMGAAINAFQDAFMRLTATLGDVGDFAYGVGIFRDETELDMGFQNLQSISPNVALVKEQIDTIESDGGEDNEEANLVALWKLATGSFVNWRDGAERIILLYGDAVGHEPTCFDDVVLDRRVVASALNEADITVQAIGTSFAQLDETTIQFGCGNGSAPSGQTTFITTNTGGSVSRLEIDDVENVLSVFPEVLGDSSGEIRIAKSTCGRGLRLVFNPKLPASLGAARSLKTTISLKKGVCNKRRSFACSITFASGDFISKPLSLRFRKIKGCP